jgi:hypothetical protein
MSEVLKGPRMQFKTDYFLLYGLDASNKLKLDFYNYNFELTSSCYTGIVVPDDYQLHQLKHNVHYFLFRNS